MPSEVHLLSHLFGRGPESRAIVAHEMLGQRGAPEEFVETTRVQKGLHHLVEGIDEPRLVLGLGDEGILLKETNGYKWGFAAKLT